LKLENIILSNLAFNEEYSRKVIPFLRDDYFLEKPEKITYQLIDAYIKEYNKFPSKEALAINLSDLVSISQEDFDATKDIIEVLDSNFDNKNLDWLLDKTEKFCQDKAIYNAIMASIKIINDKDGQLTKNNIPKILQDALSVSFETQIGHDFLDDADKRWDKYVEKTDRIPFDLEYLNYITRGGLPKKTLNVILAGTGVGKSMFMCHCAAYNLIKGYNVLYITMEMAEEEIARRIDANLLNIPIQELETTPKDRYSEKIERLKKKTTGKLIIKEYPTATAGSANFRHLLEELKLKKGFVPDIIYIDYINICVSSRFKASANLNSYTIIKSIAEELRGLAVEFNLPIVSATQTTRSGFSNSDPGLEDTSESFGLPQTVDFMFALITNEELEDLGQILCKQLKNRYNDPTFFRKFFIGIDKPKMRFYDVEQDAQENTDNDVSVMDRTSTGDRINSETKERNKRLFDDFK
jgi:replicative DNA helicase